MSRPHSTLDKARALTDYMERGEREEMLAYLGDLEEQLEALREAVETFLAKYPEHGSQNTSDADTNFVLRGDLRALQAVSSPAISSDEELVTDENLAARVQEAKRIIATGDEAAAIAYLVDRPVEDVRRVVGSPASRAES